MKLKIYQRKGINKHQLISKVIYDLREKLFTDKALDTLEFLTIRVVTQRTLKRAQVRSSQFIYGTAFVDEDLKHGYIQIDNSVDDKMLVETLAHEMTHIAQYTDSRLQTSAACWKWLNEEYPIPSEYEDYHNSPWEKEARIIESTYVELLRDRGEIDDEPS